MVFLALSQAPPALDMNTASSWPTRITPARKPGQCLQAEEEADDDRRDDGQEGRGQQFLLGRWVTMSTTLP